MINPEDLPLDELRLARAQLEFRLQQTETRLASAIRSLKVQLVSLIIFAGFLSLLFSLLAAHFIWRLRP